MKTITKRLIKQSSAGFLLVWLAAAVTLRPIIFYVPMLDINFGWGSFYIPLSDANVMAIWIVLSTLSSISIWNMWKSHPSLLCHSVYVLIISAVLVYDLSTIYNIFGLVWIFPAAALIAHTIFQINYLTTKRSQPVSLLNAVFNVVMLLHAVSMLVSFNSKLYQLLAIIELIYRLWAVCTYCDRNLRQPTVEIHDVKQEEIQDVELQKVKHLHQENLQDVEQEAIHEEVIHAWQQETIHKVWQEAIHDVQQEVIQDVQQEVIHDVQQEAIHDQQQEAIHNVRQEAIQDVQQEVIQDVQQEAIQQMAPPLVPDYMESHRGFKQLSELAMVNATYHTFFMKPSTFELFEYPKPVPCTHLT